MQETIKTVQNSKSHYFNARQIYWWSKLVGLTSCYSYLLILKNRELFSWRCNAKTVFSAIEGLLNKENIRWDGLL